MSMSIQYQILIDMDQDTVEALGEGGYYLYACKAVAAAQNGDAVVWFASVAYSETTQVNWTDDYQAYTSLQDVIAGGEITATFVRDIALDQTLVVETTQGTGEVVNGGQETAMSIQNTTETQMTGGLAGAIGSLSSELCAFTLYGNQTVVVAPMEKVLLMFATQTVSVGTVIEEAYSECILVDLTSDNQRSVSYDINAGWEWGGGAWATDYPAGTDLTPLLIEQVDDTRQVSEVPFERRALISV